VDAIFDMLARAGILTRPFAGASDWLRFGLPGGEAAWSRLADALDAVGVKAYSEKVDRPFR
jgi:cobalamin biosynthetic protein CobC